MSLTPSEFREIQLLSNRKSRESLIEYALRVHRDFRPNWHHKLIAQKLEQVERGEIKRLIISMPPRHGKTELASRMFPSWCLGRNPELNFIAASYSATLANKINKDVQRLMDEPSYKDIFPKTSLPTMKDKNKNRKAAFFDIVGGNGSYMSVGVGGGVTGHGAQLCFESSTKVLTQSGYKLICELNIGDKVWSYNHEKLKCELRKIKNISSKMVSKTIEVETSCGSRVVCTPEHRFYVVERGYTEAKDINVGETAYIATIFKNKTNFFYFKMQTLWGKFQKKKSRLSKIYKEGNKRVLLFQQMFKNRLEYPLPKKMCDLLRGNGYKNKKVLQKVQKKYDIGDQTKLQQIFSNHICINKIKRPVQMLVRLWGKIVSTSYKRKQERRQATKLVNAMQKLSFKAPLVGKTKFKSFKNSEKEVRVFDIEVGGNHNFFAEGILVHNCLIDDPIKSRAEAESLTYRNAVWDWYTNDIYTRLEDNGAIVVIMTRWHEDDLVGRLLHAFKINPKADEWEVLELPALLEDVPKRGDIRNMGEALWPSRFSVEQLMKIRESIGSYAFEALYQQRPSPKEGTIIKRDWIKHYFLNELPGRFDEVIITFDFAEGTEKGDFTVGQVWARHGSKKYLLDQVRARMETPESVKAVINLSNSYKEARAKLLEKKSTGVSVIQLVKSKLGGIIEVKPTDSKEVRLRACAADFEAGDVYLPDPYEQTWVSTVIEETCNFGAAKNDDTVDAMTMALQYWHENTAGSLTDDFLDLESSLVDDFNW